MKKKYRALAGSGIAFASNAIANYATFGSLQPANIIVSMAVGAVMGYMLIDGRR